MFINRKKRSYGINTGSSGSGGGPNASGGPGGEGGAGFFPIGDTAMAEDVDATQDANDPNSPQFWLRLQELGGRIENELVNRVGDVQNAQNRGLNDPAIIGSQGDVYNIDGGGGGGVTTYGWKMYEDEHERIMKALDVQELLQRLREAQNADPAATGDFLGNHPNLAAQLAGDLFAAAGSGGNGVGLSGSATMDSAMAASYTPGGWA